MDTAPAFIDGLGPLPKVRPATVAELGNLVRQAGAEEKAVYPVGGGTMLDIGLPPKRPGYAVDVTGLANVVDYPARDMTVTVGAGIAIAALQKLLAAEKQRLPVDIPLADRATLGGALAVNVSGPRRHGYGTLRDYVIGISTVNDEGQETKAGGRVVKNVAGYDLCKLHIGALGTLGVITQVTLKVRPLPEAQALLTLGCAAADLAAILDRLHESRTRPICVDLLNGNAARRIALPATTYTIVVGYEDREDSVNWQLQQLRAEMAALPVELGEVRTGPAADSLWRSLVEATHPADAVLSFKANVLPGAVAVFCAAVEKLTPEIVIHAHAGCGIVRGHIGQSLSQEAAARLVTSLQTAAGSACGNVVFTRCSTAWKSTMPVWGMPRPDWAVMRKVKEQFDPKRIFNPGRFVDGI